MDHAQAHHLICRWAAAELAEVRKKWYPSSSAGYRDWEPPRDPDTRQERQLRVRDDGEIEFVGWVIHTLKPVHRESILRFHFHGGKPRPYHVAVSAFSRAYESWDILRHPTSAI